MSESGHAVHPDEIIASCQALQAHITKVQDDAERMLRDWQASIKEQELAEKRRVAPGWLDREEKILEPERSGTATGGAPGLGNAWIRDVNIMDWQDDGPQGASQAESSTTAAGDELDRAFGGMVLEKEQ